MPEKVIITGGSGLLGRKITEKLLAQGFEVAWLSRKPSAKQGNIQQFFWNPALRKMDENAIHWPEYVINLAGESIGTTPWTTKGKKLILESRINSVETLAQSFSLRKMPLKGFVGVSGLGFYGPSDVPKKETDPAGTDFPARVAQEWELAYDHLPEHIFSKKCILRLTVVLSTLGGAMPKMMQPIALGLGAPLGNGKQPFSWIHLEDAADAFVFFLGKRGTYNLAAPQTVNNKTITGLLARELHRPILLPPVPAIALKLLLGDRSTLVLEGTIPDLSHLAESGFIFQFPELKPALAHLFREKI